MIKYIFATLIFSLLLMQAGCFRSPKLSKEDLNYISSQEKIIKELKTSCVKKVYLESTSEYNFAKTNLCYVSHKSRMSLLEDYELHLKWIKKDSNKIILKENLEKKLIEAREGDVLESTEEKPQEYQNHSIFYTVLIFILGFAACIVVMITLLALIFSTDEPNQTWKHHIMRFQIFAFSLLILTALFYILRFFQ